MRVDTASRTAEGIAAARARESAKPAAERIFHDPFARHFLGRRYRVIRLIPPLGWFLRRRNGRILPGMFGGLVARTRFMDDHLVHCVRAGIEQLVILGAGYDARAYRFKELLSGIRVFEVDHPATQQVKVDKLRQFLGDLPAHVTYVSVRFNRQGLEQPLPESGYDPGLKTLFIWEGVTMYLTARGIDSTLAFISGRSAPGSSVVFDYFPPSVAAGICDLREAQTLRKMVIRFGEEIRFGIEPQELEDFLVQRGFQQVRTVAAETCKQLYFSGKNAGLPVSRLFHFAHATVAPKY